MYVFDLNKLNEGDILLIKTDERFSNIMLEKTGCIYHHAMLYVGGSSYIDSDKGPGVQSGNAMRITFNNPDDAVALRLKEETDYLTMEKIIHSVRAKIGTEYSGKEAKQTIATNIDRQFDGNRQFCTRLVAQAYRDGGIKLVEDPNYCSPQDLISSPMLTVSTGILKIGSETEIAFASEENPITAIQIEITNSILKQVRELCNEDIQSLEQITNYLIANPQWDTHINNIIIESGYLNLWRQEKEANPQYYDVAKFTMTYAKENWIEVGWDLLDAGNSSLYIYMLNTYKQLYQQHKLFYLETLIALYQNLIGYTQERESVAYYAIDNGINEND